MLQEGYHLAYGSKSTPEVKMEAMVQYLLGELELHYLTARTDMLLAARTRPIHGETAEANLHAMTLCSVCAIPKGSITNLVT